MASVNVSQSLYTTVAHKFLSIIVYHVLPSVIEINHSLWFQNIQAPHNVHCTTVQLESGVAYESLKQRIEYQNVQYAPPKDTVDWVRLK